MFKKYLMICTLIHLNASACSKEELKEIKPKIELTQGIFYHNGNRPGLVKRGDIYNLKGFVYNDTPQSIYFWAQGESFTINRHEQINMPKTHVVGRSGGCYIEFNVNSKNAPTHTAFITNWLYPGIGDYGIVIKKDTSGVTDLTMDVLPKKEFDELIAKRTKEIQQKIGKEIHQAGVNPPPVANIAAEYVGTDIELPEAQEANYKAEKAE